MKKNYKWDNKEILKQYILLRLARRFDNTWTEEEYEKLCYDIDMISDLIMSSMIKITDIYLPMSSHLHVEKYFEDNSIYYKDSLSEFAKDNIKKIISATLNSGFEDILEPYCYDNEKAIEQAKLFLSAACPKMKKELDDSMKKNRFLTKSNNRNYSFAGSTYYFRNKAYYHIELKPNNNAACTISHEIFHGLIAKLTNNKLDNPRYSIYRELGSALSELYSSDYLYKAKEISDNDYVNMQNMLFYINLLNNIELINILLEASKNNATNKTEINKIIDSFVAKDPTYNYTIPELAESSLAFFLSYLYSFGLALSFYDRYKDPKEGLNAAILFLKEIDENNEQEMFKKYYIDINKGIKNYVKKNNEQIKRNN